MRPNQGTEMIQKLLQKRQSEVPASIQAPIGMAELRQKVKQWRADKEEASGFAMLMEAEPGSGAVEKAVRGWKFHIPDLFFMSCHSHESEASPRFPIWTFEFWTSG